MPDLPEPLMDPADCIRDGKFPRSTFYDMLRNSTGPKCMRFGRLIRITPSDWRAWLKSREVNPDTPDNSAVVEVGGMRLRRNALARLRRQHPGMSDANIIAQLRAMKGGPRRAKGEEK